MAGRYFRDTADTLGFLAAGKVDIAVTYNEAAEKQAGKTKSAAGRKYGFRDHCCLVGPRSDPTQFADCGDDLAMFNRIVNQGNKDLVTLPDDRDPVRFLSRFDKCATNIKESALFCKIGQVQVTSVMNIFAEGRDVDPDDPLLIPAYVLRGSKAKLDHDGKQKVIRDFKEAVWTGRETALF